MPLTKIKSLGITDGTIIGDDINSTFNLTGKTVTLPAGTGGKVLQVITATDSTSRSTTSTSFVTSSNSLSITITPSSSSSKIFLIAGGAIGNSTGGYWGYITIYRGVTNIGGGGSNSLANLYQNNGETYVPFCMTILDSPATTSATTYQVYIKSSNSANTFELNPGTMKSSITAFEIGA